MQIKTKPTASLQMKRHLFASFGLLLSAASGVFASPATIAVQLTNQTALIGESVSFSLDVTGTPPIQCQWFRNGVALTGPSTNPVVYTLTRTNISVTTAGSYYAVVSNSEGTNTSQRARLYVAMTNAVSTPIAMTGWNRDVILENTATPFAQSFDEATNSVVYGVWSEEGFGGNPNALPQSRQITSAINRPDVIFELQPYNSSNVLWMTAFTASQRTNTLTVVTPKAFVSLSIAAASGYGDQSPSSTPAVSGYLVLNFADGSKSVPVNLISLDWYVFSPPTSGSLSIAGLGNHYTTNSGTSFRGVYNGVALHQTDINLLALGCAGKSLVSITFVGAQSSQYSNRTTTGIFAVSGVATDLGINPPVFLQSDVTNQNLSKATDLVLSVVDGGTQPIAYQWAQQQFSSSQPRTTIAGATNAVLIRTNLVNPMAYHLEARNPAGVATASAEFNLYFGGLSLSGTTYSWGWSFFRFSTVRAQESTNLVDWTTIGTYNTGFSRSDSKQSTQKFFRIVPQ